VIQVGETDLASRLDVEFLDALGSLDEGFARNVPARSLQDLDKYIRGQIPFETLKA
jgi:hypothetical protein